MEHKEELRKLVATTYKEWYFTGDRELLVQAETTNTIANQDQEDVDDDNVSH